MIRFKKAANLSMEINRHGFPTLAVAIALELEDRELEDDELLA